MRKTLIMVSIGVAFLLAGCKQVGCTDEIAKNYDADAEDDDGTCKYTATILIYCDSARTRQLFDDGVSTPVYIYYADEKVGELNYFNYMKSIPNCDESYGDDPYQEVFRYDVDLVRKEDDTIDIDILDSNGDIISTANQLIDAAECKILRI